MMNSKQAGFSRPLVALVSAVCAALAMGTAVALGPTNAAPVATSSGAFAGPTGYLPNEIAGQYKPAEDITFYE